MDIMAKNNSDHFTPSWIYTHRRKEGSGKLFIPFFLANCHVSHDPCTVHTHPTHVHTKAEETHTNTISWQRILAFLYSFILQVDRKEDEREKERE